ncbi:auxilin-like clathrin-binding protein required for normal clathrin function [Kalmusia sp. IMI 367209]|nr:auxilin-like clathrin-binding protein required for normal clathrin function [Kalmusia sp. IMI 367209]
MDDLAGLDWSAPPKQQSSTPPAFPQFRPSPAPQLSGRSTPLSAQQSGAGVAIPGNRPFKAPSKPATPANDSFAGLVSTKNSKSASNNLSLQERQRQLQEEKLRQEAERQKQFDAHFGGSNSSFLDNLGSGKSTPEPVAAGLRRPTPNASGRQNLSQTINKPFAGLDTTTKRPVQSPPADDDLLSAFNASAPVDASSHFPPPAFGSGRSTPANGTYSSRGHTPAPQASNNSLMNENDEDMFGLNQLAQKPTSHPPPATAPTEGDDDILGLLGKPVSEFQTKPTSKPLEVESSVQRQSTTVAASPHDKAVAELVDMGFPAEKSAIALATTESGLDVQAAVGWLLNQAHAEAKQKTQERSQDRARHSPDEFDERPRRNKTRPTARDSSAGGSTPAWMRGEEGRSRSGQRRPEGQTQEKDVSQYASELGSNFLKSANSLWKTSQKKVQKAVADFQQDGDPNVPKWMRDAQSSTSTNQSRAKAPPRDVTDEAMMLEAGGRPAKPARPSAVRHDPEPLPVRPRREQPDMRQEPRTGRPDRMSSQSPSLRQQPSILDKRPASKLTRQDLEEQSPQAYVSPSRRKKTTPQPDLFFSEQPTAPTSKSGQATPASRQSTPAQSNNPFLGATSAPKARSPAVTPPPPRPRAPPRQIPPASSSALNSSASYRQKGSEAFKRGDYSAAHSAYSSALGPLPQTHPVTIIVLCNRAVTNIKVGDPKAAIADADAALAIIGVSRGEGEKIILGGTEGDKDMKEFYGKALMRKAEALENMEKWADAGKVWREAVEAGVGGSISIQGRNRCDKAAGGGTGASAPAAAKRPPVRKPPPPKPSAMSDLGGGSAVESEAVKKLKAANAAAEKADDEKFALSDQVDAKLIAWKGTKADNLRALLGSLDKVLWPEAGWNKVNMGDLVMPNKVKIIYMKAIAKVHPDKISQSATTEQKMISAAVFATLNEAWDKFKTENGLYAVVFSPQIIENWKRSSAEGLSVVFITVWLLGDFFNIFGAVLQGVLPTMIILAVYYTLADIVLLGQYFWYEGFRLTDKPVSREDSSEEDEDEGGIATEQSPLLSDRRHAQNGAGNGFHTPPRISDIDRRGSAQSQSSFRERFLSVSGTHLSPVTPLHDDSSSASKPLPRPAPAQSTLQTIFFNLGIIILVCASGVFGWWLSTTRSYASTPPPTDSSPETLQFNIWGQIFGYICAALYLGSRVPQLLLNYRRKSTEGISMLFFLFACIGNLTYVLSIVAYKPVCGAKRGKCREGEALGIYGRYIAVNFSWLLGSFGTLLLDAGVFVQYFLYRADEESSDEEGEAVR